VRTEEEVVIAARGREAAEESLDVAPVEGVANRSTMSTRRPPYAAPTLMRME